MTDSLKIGSNVNFNKPNFLHRHGQKHWRSSFETVASQTEGFIMTQRIVLQVAFPCVQTVHAGAAHPLDRNGVQD